MQLTNDIKHTLGLTQAHMEQALNGGRLMTVLKRDLPSGILLQKTQNILSLQQKTL